MKAAFLCLLLIAVVAATEIVSDLQYDAGDALHEEGLYTRGVVRRHGRFDRAHNQENHEELMGLLEKLEDHVTDMDDSEKEELKGAMDEFNEEEGEQEEHEEEEGEENADRHAAQEEEQGDHQIEKRLHDSSRRGELRRVRGKENRDAHSLRKMIRRDNSKNSERRGFRRVDGLLRRDFKKLNDQSKFRKLARKERRALRKNNRGAVRGLYAEERRQQKERDLHRQLRRMQRAMRRQYNNRSFFRREMENLSDSFDDLSHHLKHSERRNARQMGRKWRRFSEKGQESNKFSSLRKQLRREADKGKKSKLFKAIMKMLNHGFEEDREKDRDSEDSIQKKLSETETEETNRRRFRDLEKAQDKDASKISKDEKKTKKQIARDLRRQQQQDVISRAFRGLHKLLQHIAAKSLGVTKNALYGRMHGAVVAWLKQHAGGSSRAYKPKSALGRLVHGAVRRALSDHFKAFRSMYIQKGQGYDRSRYRVIPLYTISQNATSPFGVNGTVTPYQAAFSYPPPDYFPRWRSNLPANAGLAAIIHDAVTHALAYRSWLASKKAMDAATDAYKKNLQNNGGKYRSDVNGGLASVIHAAVKNALIDHNTHKKAAEKAAEEAAKKKDSAPDSNGSKGGAVEKKKSKMVEMIINILSKMFGFDPNAMIDNLKQKGKDLWESLKKQGKDYLISKGKDFLIGQAMKLGGNKIGGWFKNMFGKKDGSEGSSGGGILGKIKGLFGKGGSSSDGGSSSGGGILGKLKGWFGKKKKGAAASSSSTPEIGETGLSSCKYKDGWICVCNKTRGCYYRRPRPEFAALYKK